MPTGRSKYFEWLYNEKFGKGEWAAETLEDAREMACDFAEGVS